MRWIPPRQGVFKLNTDGSLRHGTGLATAGRLIRDDSGHWIRGFSANIGITTSFMAELWALFYGLRLCIQLQLERIVVELDSASIVQLLEHEQGMALSSSPRILSVLLLECLSMIATFSDCSIQHTLQ